MQWRMTSHRLDLPGRTAWVSVLVGLILLLGACGVSPQLHALVCANANQPWDHCAVTLFVGGTVEAPLAQAMAAVLFLLLALLPCWSVNACRVALPVRLTPPRAPPSDSFLR